MEVDSDGGILVSAEGTTWMLSPAAVTSVTDPDPQQSTASGDMGSEDPLGTKLWHKSIESLSKDEQSKSKRVKPLKRMKTDLLRGCLKFSRPLTKRDEQFNVIYVTQPKTAPRNEQKYSSTAQVRSIIPEICLLTIAVDFFSSGLFSLLRDFQRQAHEQEDRGLLNAAQSDDLLRLKEILDANPERVLFFLHSFYFCR